MQMQLRVAENSDRQAVAQLIHLSTNAWYQRHGMGAIFSAAPTSCGLFVDVYRHLDPGQHWVAHDEQGVLCGSCFFHPRETHLGLGIMNVHPDYFGRGIAVQLMEKADELAGSLPIRLISSALNLDSYALYHRAGFTPYAIYQDMTIPVPVEGFSFPSLTRGRVRAARPDDLPGILQLERMLLGIERRRDIDYFLNDASGLWRTAVWELDGSMGGYLTSVAHPASRLLGPGCSHSEEIALELIGWMLDRHHRGTTPVVLVPAQRSALSQVLLQWGGRICELHLAQVKGRALQPGGVVMPSFLPESG
ncbi:Predicted acetyltransferase [Serratia quinivorans]|uniref:GNAT family N-acetyltransferase n=1 Tax=Serratia quinivorans TaxID=137545 RepID=UPI00217AFB6C|nr:GNAT family N-acetyltransferase [Serratia quinivorans]CAI1922598.1 Predicted acetyltransferase [Serratia quinivorans]CAI1975093.1 Predicted acetyltransferase [Serratia quinivorans]CAI2015225.1 Predicted acetyltransferase [Serratia quinivorans]